MYFDPTGNIPILLTLPFVQILLSAIVVVGSYVAANMPSIEEHYERNQYNIQVPDYYDEEFFSSDEWDDNVAANCHQFSAPQKDNKKYVSKDGRFEAIYNSKGELVTDPRDIGTYNYAHPTKKPLKHFVKDVLPWILYGNSEDDTTLIHERALSFVGIH